MIIDYATRRIKRLWQKKFPKPEPKPTGATHCREITVADLEGIIDLLTKGFWQIRREHFEAIIRRLEAHCTAQGFPKYGYMLENNGKPVGVLLQIFTERFIKGERQIWCCGSSYYVEPSYRFYADFLLKRAQRYKDVVYLDLASTPKRWATMAKQGYRRLAQGVYAGVPVLCRSVKGAQIYAINDVCPAEFDPHESNLLIDHARFKNDISVICEADGVAYPFVFAIRRRYGMRFAFLLYSRDQSDLIKFAGLLGRFLAKRGVLFILFDADAPVEGMPGRFLSLYPKFWKGVPPRLGDLAYTEIAMFGVI